VHKLDRETSGVLVYAKNKATHEILSLQFRNHEVKKTYTALVSGIVQEDTLTIDAPLGRNKKSNKQVVNPENPRGELRSAVTHLTVLTRNKDTTVVTLSPKTGRTHQLRAHMAHIGHPIVGDGMYGTKENSTRLMLHATALSFTLHGELKEFSSPALF
jgi:23S rRNA pseudouridine1911/1915/1917 synthase